MSGVDCCDAGFNTREQCLLARLLVYNPSFCCVEAFPGDSAELQWENAFS